MAGISLEREIFEVSEKPERCIGYPIGTQLDTFVRSQANEPNFILCASIVSAAATIYSRNVDYILQEAYEMAENLSKHQETEIDNPKIEKKTRVKKFVIRDKVSVFQICFDVKVINVQEKKDINKTLTMPSKLTKLRQVRELYSKNKQNNGKLAMPKSCQLLNDTAAMSSTFGTNIIYDYDQSDVVGSRKDFASHCNIIDLYTGELLKDLSFNSIEAIPKNDCKSDKENTRSHIISNDEANNCSLPPINDHDNPGLTDAQQSSERLTLPLSINLDEGIDVDESNSLLISLRVAVHVLKLSTSQEMIDNYLNTKKNMESSNSLFTNSFYEVRDSILSSPTDFSLPSHIKTAVADCRLKNILMIPLQKLKHKCAFDLPSSEYLVLKKMKLSQHKSTVEDVSSKRMFKTIDCSKASEMIRECSVSIERQKTTSLEQLIKSEDDELRSRSRSRTPTSTLCPIGQTNDSFDSGLGITTIGNDSINVTNTTAEFGEDLDRTKKIDSCYNSMVSGMSGASRDVEQFNQSGAELASFDTDDEPIENYKSMSQKPGSSIVEMQKLATLVAGWKEHLKQKLHHSEDYDINQTGTIVINKVDSISQTSHEVSFEDIVEPGEITKFFPSLLQLLNSGVVAISIVDTGRIEPVPLSNIKIKHIGANLPGAINQLQLPQTSGSQKRKIPLDIYTSTPATKKQILQTSLSSQNDSLADESGYCSFENSQSL